MTWQSKLICQLYCLFTSKLEIQQTKIEKAHNKSAVDEATSAEVWRCYWFERHWGEDAGERAAERSLFYRQNPPIATAFDASKARTQAPGHCIRPTDAENDDIATKTIDERRTNSTLSMHNPQSTHTSTHTNTQMHTFTRKQLRRR